MQTKRKYLQKMYLFFSFLEGALRSKGISLKDLYPNYRKNTLYSTKRKQVIQFRNRQKICTDPSPKKRDGWQMILWKWWLTWYVVRELQVNITMRCPYTLGLNPWCRQQQLLPSCGWTAGILVHLLGMQPGAVTLEDSLAVSDRAKRSLKTQSSNYALWYFPNWVDNLHSHRNLCMNMIATFFPNSPKLEATKVALQLVNI